MSVSGTAVMEVDAYSTSEAHEKALDSVRWGAGIGGDGDEDLGYEVVDSHVMYEVSPKTSKEKKS